MKRSLIAFCMICALSSLNAQAPAWQPSLGHTQVPIWPRVPPHTPKAFLPETVTTTGYQILAIDLEGTEVCDWLTSAGITCVLLKYRVPNAGISWNQFCGCDVTTRSSMPLEDAQRTIGLVRFHAADWHVDPHKIGVLGFSAGGHLVAAVSTRFVRRAYPAIDAADRESSRPNFAIALYPGHLFDSHKGALNPDIRVTKNTPPTMLIQAENETWTTCGTQ
jgi:acetyl esterase/lipase